MDTNCKIVCGTVCLIIGGILVYRRREIMPTLTKAKDVDEELNAILRKKAIRITGHKF